MSAVARKDTSRVAAEIILNPKEWENQTLNLTGPENLSMEEIVELLSKETGNAITYVDESVEEAYESRKKMASTKLGIRCLGQYLYSYQSWGTSWGFNSCRKVLGHPASSLLDILRDRKLIEEKYD